MANKLSSGALETIMNGGTVDNPVMQILGSKKMAGGSSADRYRLLISDGKHLNSFAMLATQLNEKVISGELAEFTVVQLNRLITSMVNNSGKGEKRVMIILDITVLTPGEQVGERIGNPVSYDDPSANSTPTPMETSSNKPQPSRSYETNNRNAYQENKPVVSSSPSPGGDHSATHPITSLNPYQNRWTIKARCTAKSAVKTWSNARSEGKLFSMDFLDETGEIRCTAFKEAVDKFYDAVEIGKVYFVSNCILKTANKQYTHIKHDYEMTVTHNTIIALCNEVTSIPTITYDFVSIDKIEGLEDGAVIDIIGICKEANEASTFTSKNTGKEFTKRDITLVDTSNSSVNLTLWSNQATEFDGQDHPVVVVKGARMKEFNGGKTIGVQNSSNFFVNPDIPEAHRLRGWYENEGMTQEYKNVSARGGVGGDSQMGGASWVTFRQMKEKQLGCGDKPDYIMVKATIITTKHDKSIYQACPSEECNKKVVDLQNGMYRCEKCNREYGTFKYRVMTRFNLGDHTTNQFVTAFQEHSEAILGMSAQELGELEKSDTQGFQDVFNEANFKSFVFKLRVKMETYNDTSMMKATVVSLQNPINYKVYNAHLIGEIKRLHGMNKPTN